jgi:hypothetical protein
MTSPRWTYSEANASRWKPVFDAFISGQQSELEIPVAGNARSLHSLKIRIGDALKWLADQFHVVGNIAYLPYADIKPRLRFGIGQRGLTIALRRNEKTKSTDQHQPLNLDEDTLKRLSAMSQDLNYTPAERKMFAETVRQELGLLGGGLKPEAGSSVFDLFTRAISRSCR